eukprot:CAMPEP_0185282188 /NCGR_PEP_ID=MMETSP1359-20130426/67132_1 /TAXON_ID=552665 /ORGANISM="Bigelowiella longifila, Strain CCMP242" /LENGTH=86 /DNA_ID=CAMNT_0027877697 /DNA_START=384 /DNA_END=644 /DNA_ORIENTATION=+
MVQTFLTVLQDKPEAQYGRIPCAAGDHTTTKLEAYKLISRTSNESIDEDEKKMFHEGSATKLSEPQPPAPEITTPLPPPSPDSRSS